MLPSHLHFGRVFSQPSSVCRSFDFSTFIPAPISPSLTQDELAAGQGLGLTCNLNAVVAKSPLAPYNLNYRISRNSCGQRERSTLCSWLKAPCGALTQ